MWLLRILVIFFVNYFVFRTFMRRRGPQERKNDCHRMREDLIDQILMLMRSGRSYENIIHELSEAQNPWQKWILSSSQAKGNEILEILSCCRAHPSQSYGILTSYRKTLRQQGRLQDKLRLITLQAKAQAVVSGVIFLALALCQWVFNPEFTRFLLSSGGRLIFTLCLALVSAGVIVVFRMARPIGVEL